MQYFEKYTSNTVAGSSNQRHFSTEGKTLTSRVFYKIAAGGRYGYSILFSNTIDSTFSDGSLCHKNYVCDEWTICSARIGKCEFIPDRPLGELVMDEDIKITDTVALTFDGSASKTVAPGGFFACDEVELSFEEGQYLCLELTYSGNEVPYHHETILPVYTNDGEGWKYTNLAPLASMVGCTRKVKRRIGFMGDSITQGCGTTPNGYRHWNAILSERLGTHNAYWNLGIGFGRADDAASDGAWLYRAKQNDAVFVCYGVNDILQGFSEEVIKKNFTVIVDTLKKRGITVVLQTVPPFDYRGDNIGKWERINDYIKTELVHHADYIFDSSAVLSKSADEPHNSKYGGHPSDEGCAVWAEALYNEYKDIFGY